MSAEDESYAAAQRVIGAALASAPLTPYDDYVAEAYERLDFALSYADSYDDPQDTIRTKEFNDGDRANVASRLAIAEQQRIANLIALSAYEHQLNHFVEATALREMASQALGVTAPTQKRD